MLSTTSTKITFIVPKLATFPSISVSLVFWSASILFNNAPGPVIITFIRSGVLFATFSSYIANNLFKASWHLSAPYTIDGCVGYSSNTILASKIKHFVFAMHKNDFEIE